MSYKAGTATSRSIPFPVGGWNTRDPLDTLDELYAQEMDNIFPAEREGRLRGGSENFCTSGLGTGEVSTLVEHVSSSGTRVFIACANGKICNITNPASVVDLGTGFSVNRWQTIGFRGRTLFFNGTDQPQQYDGSTLSAATYTGIGTDNDLIQGTTYRNRLYLVPKNSQSFWYGGINAITGALTEFDVGPLLRKGGSIQFVTTWTRESGDSLSELFVIMSTEGEVLVYAGASPDQEGFVLVARRAIAKPLGRRAFLAHQSDVEVATLFDAVALSTILSGQATVGQGTLTDKISPTFSEAAKDYGASFGWEIVRYDRGRCVLYNIPIGSGDQSQQYVRNFLTGAWCRFKGWNAATFCVFNDALYYGTYDGKVVKADVLASDRGANIDFSLFTSYNYYGSREKLKHFAMVRPIITADGGITFGLSMSVDRSTITDLDSVSIDGIGGTPWDSGLWDSFTWAGGLVSANDWYSINGIGRAGALKMAGSVKDVRFSISAFHVTFDFGGLL